MSFQQREFTMSNPKKKHEFQEKIGTYANNHKFASKITALEENFATYASKSGARLKGRAFDVLVDQYNAIDMAISENMKSTAGAVATSDMGYQRSPELLKAIDRVRFWKAALSCLR